ncbi:zinc finger CCCH domain-containing protein 55-like [Actinidia eriantha]|uniref:zinc finger CCCH domain-containing protein 55-like n=1 Tax=Actinidia eriantha TaxID=165200 RepID=UPI002588CC09|nr:zinc finger CCCH domain-containing protein 55-like [Actinidia eriantha]XP_057479691.1 zinc finger CCCH domain-containing protein 55-like [Actinidia eriantha]
MDSSEATKIVFSRIQSLDPENASKIMGYIFIQDPGEKEMIRLACGPEAMLLSLINKAKTQLGISSNISSAPSTPSSLSPFNPSRAIPFPQSSPRVIIPNNGFHMNPSSPSSPWSVSGFSDHHHHRSPHMSPRPASSLSYAAVVNGNSNPATGSFSPSTSPSFSQPPFYSNNICSDLNDDYNLFDDLPVKNMDLADPILSPSGHSDSILFPYGNNWADPVNRGGDNHSHIHNLHRRSCSVNDALLGSDDGDIGFGWRPCMYFAKGFCKNGSTCKFSHGGFADLPDVSLGSPSKLDGFDELLRMKAIQQQRFAAASQLMAGGHFPYNKCINFMNDSPRSASAALMMGEEIHKFGRCRPGRNDFSVMGFGGNENSSSRQIYLTFPADSTFMEEDVSNYFSKFGPVQDVRIPYQQKRMFGFVTFVYPETVKIILTKGNPHFVCDSRVLVKPYKEKGKVPDKKLLQQQLERGEFSTCLSPTGLDPREPYDLPIGPRMFLNSQEVMLRRKLEQAELQQAIELQGRRMMNWQLSDLKNHHHGHQFQPNPGPGIPNPSPAQPHLHINRSLLLQSDSPNQEVLEENNSSSGAANSPTATADQQPEIKEACNNSNGNARGDLKEPENDDLHESLEHILPDNLFASPTKSAGDHRSIFSPSLGEADDSTSAITSSPV